MILRPSSHSVPLSALLAGLALAPACALDDVSLDPSAGDEHLAAAVSASSATCGNGLREPGELCFAPAERVSLPGSPVLTYFEVGYLNGAGGNLDVAAIFNDTPTAYLLFGNGDGTFFGMYERALTSTPDGVAIGYVDTDSYADVVVTNRASDRFEVLWSDTASWTRRSRWTVGDAPSGVRIAHLDANNRMDVVTQSSTSGLTLRRANATGGFSAAQSFTSANRPMVEVFDCDEDGDNDLVHATSSTIYARRNVGDGTFLAPRTTVLGFTLNPDDAAVVDFDEDGILDLVLAGDGFVVQMRGDGDCTFSGIVPHAVATLGSGQYVTVESLDYDGDRNVDVMVSHPTAGHVVVLRGNGNGGFTMSTLDALAYFDLDSGDFDGDGAPDLLYTNGVGHLLMRRSDP